MSQTGTWTSFWCFCSTKSCHTWPIPDVVKQHRNRDQKLTARVVSFVLSFSWRKSYQEAFSLGPMAKEGECCDSIDSWRYVICNHDIETISINFLLSDFCSLGVSETSNIFSLINIWDIILRWDHVRLVMIEFSLSIALTIHSVSRWLSSEWMGSTDKPQISSPSFKSAQHPHQPAP